jgi:hypothetical protein
MRTSINIIKGDNMIRRKNAKEKSKAYLKKK